MTNNPGNQQPVVPPAAPVPGQEPSAPAKEPGYITQEQFQAALDAQKKEFEEKLNKNYQGTQSLRDQVNNRVTQMEKQFTQYGITITPDMKRQMREEALFDTMTPTTGTPGQEQAAPEHEPTPEEAAIYNAGIALAKTLGTTIEDTDPEADLINKASHGTEDEYLAAWAAAASAKKTRLATNPPTQPGTPSNPDKTAARIPGLGGGGAPSSNPIANINDPDELWNRAKTEGKF